MVEHLRVDVTVVLVEGSLLEESEFLGFLNLLLKEFNSVLLSVEHLFLNLLEHFLEFILFEMVELILGIVLHLLELALESLLGFLFHLCVVFLELFGSHPLHLLFLGFGSSAETTPLEVAIIFLFVDFSDSVYLVLGLYGSVRLTSLIVDVRKLLCIRSWLLLLFRLFGFSFNNSLFLVELSARSHDNVLLGVLSHFSLEDLFELPEGVATLLVEVELSNIESVSNNQVLRVLCHLVLVGELDPILVLIALVFRFRQLSTVNFVPLRLGVLHGLDRVGVLWRSLKHPVLEIGGVHLVD